MTIAELARLFNEHHGINAKLEIMPMEGWSRDMYWDATDLPWVMPSPNMPTLDTAIVYPGTVLYEGTMLSEGRGTTRPFELIGAPWLDGDQLAERMNKVGLKGVHFRGVNFEPTFQKHARVTCGGCQIHVTSREEFLPVKAGVSLLRECYGSAPDRFQWRDPPYEYEHDKMPIDILAGSPALSAADREPSAACGYRRELAPRRRRVRGDQAELPALLGTAGLERVADRRIELPIAELVRARAGVRNVIGTPVAVFARLAVALGLRLLDEARARGGRTRRKTRQRRRRVEGDQRQGYRPKAVRQEWWRAWRSSCLLVLSATRRGRNSRQRYPKVFRTFEAGQEANIVRLMLNRFGGNLERRRMSSHRLGLALLAGLLLAASSAPALAQDAQKCFAASDRVKDGDTLDEAEKRAAHDACMRALADSSNIVQKYHLQEADFDVMGNRPTKQ